MCTVVLVDRYVYSGPNRQVCTVVLVDRYVYSGPCR